MKKNIVKRLSVLVLAGVVMMSAVACGKNDDATADNSVGEAVASDGEMFSADDLSAGEVKLLDKVYEMPVDYSQISKKFTLREEMTEKFNVKVAPNSTLNNVYLDVFNKDNAYVVVSLKNDRKEEDYPKACKVTSIVAQTGYADGGVVVLPGNVTLGTSAYDVTGLYGDPDTTIDNSEGFTYIYERGTITYTLDFAKDAEGVQKITIECK